MDLKSHRILVNLENCPMVLEKPNGINNGMVPIVYNITYEDMDQCAVYNIELRVDGLSV